MIQRLARFACLAAITCLSSPTALADAFHADCDGWHQTLSSPFRLVVRSKVELFQLVGGEWVATGILSEDTAWAPLEGSDFIPMGRLWGLELGAGEYLAVLTRCFWFGDWPDEASALAATESTEPQQVLTNETTFECIASNPPRTPGYWKNHPEDWAGVSLPLGDEATPFAQDCLLGLLSTPTRGDIRVKLAHHLIAAKLNLLNGSDAGAVTGFPEADSTVGDTIAVADAYLRSEDVGCDGLGGSKPGGSEKSYVVALKSALDAYNNGAAD